MDNSLALPLPFRTVLSLEPLVAWWRARADDPNTPAGLSRFAAELIARTDQAPELLAPSPSKALLTTHAGLVEALMMALIPPATLDTTLSGAIAPFEREVLYATPSFRRVMVTAAGQLKQPLNLSTAEINFYLCRFAYLLIMSACYDVHIPQEETIIFTVPDYSLGLYRHYKVDLDSRFMRVQVRGDLPDLPPADRKTLTTHIHDLDGWLTKLPPDRFELHGFTLLHLTDVTETQVLSTLKNDLLARDVLLAPDRLEQLQEQLRSLFRLPSLRLGLAAYRPKQGSFVTFGHRLNAASLTQRLEDPTESAESTELRGLFAQLIKSGKPLVIDDILTAEGVPDTLREPVLAMGLRNVILSLLRYGDDVLGVLELGAPVPGSLTAFSLETIEQFLPLFAVAVHRHQAAEWAQVQSIVKERFTAIHPALEWRFVEAAEDFLDQQRRRVPAPALKPIIFSEVYPLYAAIDVRGSSAARAEGVRNDLIKQLDLANRVLNLASEAQSLPIVDELRYQVRRHLLSLRDELASDDENTILNLLRTDVEPLFEYLHSITPELRAVIMRYWKALDPQAGIVYEARKKFEDSQTQLNEYISKLLDTAESAAQLILPHYFRKAVTDGVEFDIYVGASLVENKKFDTEHLKKLRLWQLQTLIEIAQAADSIKDSLPIPLATTQLLFINAEPLAIRFREDERQFDVDGARNARYEIIKKRIDKATIEGTGERLTQPGKIALVYQQAREAAEYGEYIQYLREQGILTAGPTEHLVLEPAQGVSGLQALRVEVRMAEPKPEPDSAPPTTTTTTTTKASA